MMMLVIKMMMTLVFYCFQFPILLDSWLQHHRPIACQLLDTRSFKDGDGDGHGGGDGHGAISNTWILDACILDAKKMALQKLCGFRFVFQNANYYS